MKPGRLIALALATAGWLAPMTAGAGVGDAPTGVGDARDALPGLGRIGVAELPATMWAAAWSGGYGFTESVLGGGDGHHRVGAILGASARPLPWLAVALRLDGRYDKHTGGAGDDGWIGDTRALVRIGRALGARLHLGAQVVAWFPGDAPFQPTGDGASFDGAALVDYALTPAIRVAGTAGFRIDRSAGSVPNAARLSDADRLALAVSDSNEALIGAGAAWRRGDLEVYGEWTWDVLVGAKAPGALDSPMRLGAGARVRISDTWTGYVGGEVALSSRPPLTATDPLVPVEPRLSLGVGVRWRIGAAAPVTGGRIEVTARDPDPAATTGTLRGRILAPDGRPLAGAGVHAGDGSISTVTDADGRFELRDLPLGPVTLAIDAVPPYAATTATAVVGKGEATIADVAVERALPPGQIRGVVRTVAGAAVAATVRVEPLGKQVRAGADGSFRIDVPPGSYQVVIDGPGLSAQKRKIQVEQNGVTVLNVELRPERGGS